MGLDNGTSEVSLIYDTHMPAQHSPSDISLSNHCRLWEFILCFARQPAGHSQNCYHSQRPLGKLYNFDFDHIFRHEPPTSLFSHYAFGPKRELHRFPSPFTLIHSFWMFKLIGPIGIYHRTWCDAYPEAIHLCETQIMGKNDTFTSQHKYLGNMADEYNPTAPKYIPMF